MSDNYGSVHTSQLNNIFEFMEKFGDHEYQYALMLTALVGLAKAINHDDTQLHLDINVNWARVTPPDIFQNN